MTYCCVPKCTNSSKKKYSMHRLPSDIERRKQWIKSINRCDLDPSKVYNICAIHFAPEMWERPRVDGKKKLKSCAIPTIFSWKTDTNIAQIDSTSTNIDVNSTTLNKVNEKLLVNLVEQDVEEIASTSSNIIELTRNILNEELNEITNPVMSTSNTKETISVSLNISDMKKMLEEAEKRTQKALFEAKVAKVKERHAELKLQQANKIITKLDKSKRMLMKRLHRKRKSTGQIDLLNKSIRKILNDDQIKILCWPSERCGRWCNDTLKKALRLKLFCGTKGYKEILRQGFPLPSERTLRRRRLEGTNFQPDISKPMFDILNKETSLFTDDRKEDCMPTLDEMRITEEKQIDQGIMSQIDFSTIPNKL